MSNYTKIKARVKTSIMKIREALKRYKARKCDICNRYSRAEKQYCIKCGKGVCKGCVGFRDWGEHDMTCIDCWKADLDKFMI